MLLRHPYIPNLVGFDWETHATNPLPPDPRAVCLSICTDLPLPEGVPYRQYSKPGAKRNTVLYAAKDARGVLLHFLRIPEAHMVAHNAAFDILVDVLSSGGSLRAWADALDEGRVHCTAVRESLLTIAYGYSEKGSVDPRTNTVPNSSLAYAVQAHYQVDLSNEKADPNAWRLNYSILDGVPLEVWPTGAVSYACMDSVWACYVYEAQQDSPDTDEGPLVDGAHHLATERVQVQAALGMDLMSCQMPLADPAAAERFRQYHSDRADSARKVAQAAGLVRWNRMKATKKPEHRKLEGPCARGLEGKACCGFSPCRAGWSENQGLFKQWVAEDWGAMTPRTAPSATHPDGQVSCSGEVLVDERSRAILRAYGTATENRTMVKTYLPILRRASIQRIRARFRPLVNTGRTACTKPNWQNPPKTGGFRECFVPDEGNVFASIDYAAIEVATLAQRLVEMFGESRLADALNEGMDPHSWYVSHLYNMTYEQFMAERVDPSTKNLAKKRRNAGKVIVFGVPGGMFARGMVRQYGPDTFLALATEAEWDYRDPTLASRDEKQAVAELVAKRMREVYLSADPEALPRFFEWVDVRTKFDRKFTWRDPATGFLRGRVGFRDGCNTQFQGRAAYGAKLALWRLTKACYGLSDDPADACLVGTTMWNFIHDEFLFEGPEATAHEWSHRASEIMVEEMRIVVPDVRVAAEPALMRRWWKDAEPVFENGRLVPWEPSLNTAPDEEDPLDALLAEAQAELVKLGLAL